MSRMTEDPQLIGELYEKQFVMVKSEAATTEITKRKTPNGGYE